MAISSNGRRANKGRTGTFEGFIPWNTGWWLDFFLSMILVGGVLIASRSLMPCSGHCSGLFFFLGGAISQIIDSSPQNHCATVERDLPLLKNPRETTLPMSTS